MLLIGIVDAELVFSEFAALIVFRVIQYAQSLNQVIAFLMTISCSREIALIHRVQSYYDTIIQVAHLRQECHNSKSVIFQETFFNGFEVL